MSSPEMIVNPALIVLHRHDRMETRLYPQDMTCEQYGIVIADVVRHVARAYSVSEDQVWTSVERERQHPTSPVSGRLFEAGDAADEPAARRDLARWTRIKRGLKAH